MNKVLTLVSVIKDTVVWNVLTLMNARLTIYARKMKSAKTLSGVLFVNVVTDSTKIRSVHVLILMSVLQMLMIVNRGRFALINQVPTAVTALLGTLVKTVVTLMNAQLKHTNVNKMKNVKIQLVAIAAPSSKMQRSLC